MSETVVAKIKRKPTKIEVTQSLNVIITTIGVEIIVAPSTNVVKSGVLIAFQYKEGHAIMDYPFVPFHIKTSIARHAELQNVAGTLMD